MRTPDFCCRQPQEIPAFHPARDQVPCLVRNGGNLSYGDERPKAFFGKRSLDLNCFPPKAGPPGPCRPETGGSYGTTSQRYRRRPDSACFQNPAQKRYENGPSLSDPQQGPVFFSMPTTRVCRLMRRSALSFRRYSGPDSHLKRAGSVLIYGRGRAPYRSPNGGHTG